MLQLPQVLVPRHDGWAGPLRRRSARQAKFWAGRWRREQRSSAWFAALAWNIARLTRRWPFTRCIVLLARPAKASGAPDRPSCAQQAPRSDRRSAGELGIKPAKTLQSYITGPDGTPVWSLRGLS